MTVGLRKTMFEVNGNLTGQVLNSLMCMKFDLRRDICLDIIQLVKKEKKNNNNNDNNDNNNRVPSLRLQGRCD